MIRTGEVVEQCGDMVSVVFERPAACASCKGCLGNQCTRIELEAKAEIGDLIDVEMPDESILTASALTYLVPLVLMLVGILFSGALREALDISINEDLFSALCGILMLTAGLFAVARIDKALVKRKDWQPRVVRVYERNDETQK